MRIVQDQATGEMSEYPSDTDVDNKVKAYAKEMRDKGFSLSQIIEAAEKQGGMESEKEAKGFEFVNGKKVKKDHKTNLSDKESPSLKKLVAAYEALEMEEGEKGSVQGKTLDADPKEAKPIQGGQVWEQREADVVINKSESFNGGLFQQPESLDFSALFGNEVIIDTAMSKLGSAEMSMLLTPLVDRSREELTSELGEGNTLAISDARDVLNNTKQEQEIQRISREVDLAATPEEVAGILEQNKDVNRKPISMVDFRQNFVVSSLEIPTERMRPLSLNIERDAIRSSELAKQQEKIWEQTGVLGILGDFAELALPTGVLSEEYDKFNNGISDALDKIKNAPQDKQEEVFNAVVDSWLKTETFLIQNNNSILIADQLAGMESAIREGGLGLINGDWTEAEFEDAIESAINITLFGGELKAAGKGIKGLMKFLAYRIFPSKEKLLSEGDRIPFVPFTDTGNTLNITPPTGVNLSHKVDFVYDTRTGTTAYDHIVKERLSDFHKNVKDKGLKQTAEDVGLSTEAMAARLLPTPSDTTDLGYPNLPVDVNELILMDEDVLLAGEKRAKALARSTGSSLKLQNSSMSIVENADEASRGDFKFLLGDGDEGFESSSIAEEAMNNSLVGVDRKSVVERDGKWYIEVQQKHEFNPRYDTTDLGVDTNKINNKSALLLDPLRRLGEDVLNGVFALKGYNRSKAQKMQTELESIFSKDNSVLAKVGLKPMDALDVDSLTIALKHTDQDGVDWISSVDEFASITGRTPEAAQNTYKRYKRIQKLMDDIYQIRNEKYRKSLVARDVKDVTIGDEVHRGSVVNNPNVKEVYDIRTKKNVAVEDLDTSQAVVRLEKAILDESGEYRRLVVSNKGDVKELPSKVLNQREGHIDRFYRDAGWTVKIPVQKTVDGAVEESFSTTHIVKTEEQANKEAAKLLEKEGVEATVTRARENNDLDGIYGDESSVQFGYAGAHTKQRGRILRGADGLAEAETLGVLESLSRAVGGVERQLDVDIINSLRSRFLKQFEQYFKKKAGTSYSGRLEDMLDASKVPSDVAKKAKQWHQYIENISSVKQGEGFQAIDNFVKETTTLGVDSQRVSSALQNFATQMVIVGRPVFQIIQNTTQLLYVSQKYPLEMASTIKNIIPTLSALKNSSPENIKSLAKSMKVSEEVAQQFVKEIKDNGLWDAVGMSDDFMKLVQRNSIDATPTKAGNAVSMTKNAALSPFTASKAGQEGIIKLTNLAAYMSEFQRHVIKGGKKFDAKTKADMSFNAQKITQTQNSVNQFDYQSKSSVLSPMFQFTQHVHKLYLDVIVDPALKLTKDPILKAMGKETPERVSPLATTHLQAAGSLLTTYMVFGPQGIFGGILGAEVEDAINQIENPIAREVLQGNMMNQVVNSTVNALGAEGQVDFSAKMHPASVVDTFYDYHIKKFMMEGSLSMAGAAGYVVGMVGSAANAVIAISGTGGLTWDDKASNIVSEIMGTVAGISDYQRAYMSYHLGNYVYKSSLSGNLPVTTYEAIMQMGNFTPTAIQDRWQEFSSDSAVNDDAVKSLARVYSRAMHRELARATSLEEMLSIGAKYSSIAVESVDPLKRGEIVQGLARYVSADSGNDFLGYIKPYIDQRDLGDVVGELKSLREDASTDEMRRQIDSQIIIVESMIPEIEKAYGK